MGLKDALEAIRIKMHEAMRPHRPMQELAGRGNDLRGGGAQPLDSVLAHMRAKIRNPREGVPNARPGNE